MMDWFMSDVSYCLSSLSVVFASLAPLCYYSTFFTLTLSAVVTMTTGRR